MATLLISGTVTHQNGTPIHNISVVINERQLRSKKKLIEGRTQAKGNFSLSLENVPDNTSYFVEVLDMEDKTLLSRGPFLAKNGNRSLKLVVDDPRLENVSFKTNEPTLSSFVTEWRNDSTPQPITADDARFVSEKTGLPPAETWRWLKAHQLETETSSGAKKIPAETLYGLLKQGLPGNMLSLSALPSAEIEAALKQAQAAKQISDTVSVSDLMKTWRELLGSKSLSEKAPGVDASLGEILSIAGASASHQQKMMELFSQHQGSDEQFWSQMATIITDANKVARIRKALQLTAFTGFQPVLLGALLNESMPAQLHPLAALAGRDEQDWEAFIQTASARKSAIPQFIKGSNDGQRRQRYAAQLAKTTEEAFPTPAFFGRLSKLNSNSGGFGSSKAELQAFFSKNPGFDFKTATIAALAEGTGLDLTGISNPQNLLKELRSVRRMMGFTLNNKALQTLRAAGLDSAQAVASMSRRQFVKKYSSAFSTVAEAERAHRLAEKKTSELTALWTTFHPNLNVETAATRGSNANLRSLFGSLEACDCEHCISVYSPAAYLTDILHFLESRSRPAYDELLRRRPDLPGLLLNCENTNTPLPYVDLVIELLENRVTAIQPSSGTYQTSGTAAELAANPEHSNASAYDVLKTAVYPTALPFHFPLAETREYLSHLDIPRHRLMTVFFPGKEIAAFEDRHIAFEFLGMSVQERDIITAQNTGDGSANSGVWNFFGFDKATGFRPIADPFGSGNLPTTDNWVSALTARVDVFLQQTGLLYIDLLALLSCDFINPKTGNLRKMTIAPKAENDPATCQFNLLQLNGLNETDLLRMHRFLRLSRRLNWTVYELDKALKSMGISGFNSNGTPKPITAYLTADQLRRLSQTEQLRRRFNCTVEEVLGLWFNLRADTYSDFAQENQVLIPSLYEKLFRNKAVLNPLNPALKTDPGTLLGNLDDQAATIQAALQISDAEYRLLRGSTLVLPDGKLNLSNLSSLYRHVALARWVGITVADLLTVIGLSGTNPFANQPEMHAFLWKLELIQNADFSIAELDYLLRNRFVAPTGIAPTEAVIMAFIAEIRAMPQPSENTTAQKFLATFGLSPKACELLLIRHLKSAADSSRAMVQDFLLAGVSDSTLALNYRRMAKVVYLIEKFKISDEELEQLLQNQVKIGCLDFNALPVTAQENAHWAGFEILLNLIRTRDGLRFSTTGLFEVIGHAISTNPDKQLWVSNLLRLSNWDAATLDTLIGKASELSNGGILKTNFPADFGNAELILRVKKSLEMLRILGLNAGMIKEVVLPEVNLVTAQAIKQAVKAKYTEAQWQQHAKPLRDALREQQRAALVAYSLGRSNEWRSVEELYEYLLIDVEMKPVSMTSRLKQATCSVQLFIDRVLMNLERNADGAAILLDAEQALEWKAWRKIYRIWEANRKIFLYPENWIEPELRDDQTPFFREVTSALLQNELTPETVEDAFRGYLEKLDEVARLEIVGINHQQEPAEGEELAIDILHVFGRTYTQPHQYFHRTLEKGEWSPWLKIETDIDSDHLVPVVFNRRLCLFWLFFTQEAEEAQSIDPSKVVEKTKYLWKIQVAWSEYRKNTWTGKKLSKSFVQTQKTDSKTTLEKLRSGIFLRHYQSETRLFLHLKPSTTTNLFQSYFTLKREDCCQASFVFQHTGAEPIVKLDALPPEFSMRSLGKNNFENQQIQNQKPTDPLVLWYDSVDTSGTISESVSVSVFKRDPHPRYHLLVEAGAIHPLLSAFVYQDNKHSFWVRPSRYIKPDTQAPLPDLPDMFALEGATQEVWGQEILPLNMARPVGDLPNFPDFDLQLDRDEGDNPPPPPQDEMEIKCPNGLLTFELLGSATFIDLNMLPVYAPSVDSTRRIRYSFSFTTFYHPQAKKFIRALNKSGVSGVLKRSLQESSDLLHFQEYDPKPAVISNQPQGIVDFTYGSPYSQYNWELFFHLPIHIACRLGADQRFEEARRWFHFVFDPTTGEAGGKERFWQFAPFYAEAKAPLATLSDLLNNQNELLQQVEKWAANPFQPHVIARMRITAYMKFTVMKYIENLIAWGDQLFRRDTIESINEATNLYVLAAKILGPAPQKVPARTQVPDRTFNDLINHLDAFSNVNLEDLLADSTADNQTSDSGTASALGSLFYFCVPRNEYLLQYWEKVADRLFKIRHSLNIEGVARSLPLFEPPIDPALLVRAAAAGLDLNSLLNEVNPGVSLYRFAFMLQKASEVVNEVKGLGAALLSALEKRDVEQLSLLRSKHEQHLLSVVLQVRERQVEEAKETLAGTKKSLDAAKLRLGYYSSREKISRYEGEALKNTDRAQALTFLQGEYNTFASVLSGIPELKVGAPTSVGSEFGGIHLSAIYSGLSAAAGTAAGIFSASANLNSTLGSYERRMDDWKFQADQAKIDIEQLEKQVLASEIRLAIASRELSNHKLQMEQVAETDEFMRSKFSNQQLFDWMVGQLSTLYFQTYQMAYDLAKQAEKCLQFELPQTNSPGPGFIQFGYWDNLKKGLLAGEKLQFDLRRLEMAYLEQNKREFEISKHISLRQIDPLAMIALRNSGTCHFALSENLYDLDFPGHYRRRIKSVSISIPCITGPYTGLNATLRLAKNGYRMNPDLNAVLIENNIPSSAIAVSNGQNDSGLFELNFRDERYLPFEGAGAISEWALELPEFRQFDYNTISDVVLHVRYTALEDAGLFKTRVIEQVKRVLNQPTGGLFAIVDLQHDLPNEWHLALQSKNTAGQHVLTVPDLQRFLPYFALGKKVKITKTEFLASVEITEISTPKAIPTAPFEVNFKTTGAQVQSVFMVIQFSIT